MNQSVVIVIPALNEEEGIGKVLDEIGELNGFNCEIVVVDGGSTDRTVQIASAKHAKVIFQRGKGYGNALQEGFDYASQSLNASIIVMIDADGTYLPSEINRFLPTIVQNGAGLVIGNRFAGLTAGAMSFTNRLGNHILSFAARWALKIDVSDTQCGMRAIRASLWKQLDMKAYGMPFAIEMLAEAREVGTIVEVPITYLPRIGSSKLAPSRDGISIAITILRLARDYQPLLFFGGIGAVLILLGILLGIVVVVEWLQTGVITRTSSVVLSSTLLLGGGLVLVLGLVADMIKNVKRFLRRRI
jgi:dolichol-phosphate mannosyltransferase